MSMGADGPLNDPAGGGVAWAVNPARLGAPTRLLLDTYAALNAQSPHPFGEADAIAGALLEATPPAALGEGALERALAAIEAADAKDRALETARDEKWRELAALPDPTRDIAVQALGQRGWRVAGPGIRTLELAREGEATAELLRIEPGHGAPRHGHGGEEYTLVLAGAFHDGRQRFGRGDLCVARTEDVHRPVAEPGAVCFALAVSDAPPAFGGLLGLAQRLMGRA